MDTINGIAVSNGIAIAKAVCLVEPDLSFQRTTVANVDEEKTRFEKARLQATRELERIKEQAEKKFGSEKAAIFAAHLLVLNDPDMLATIHENIANGTNAEAVVDEVTAGYIQMFETMDNDYMKERAADLRDVRKRLLANLLGVTLSDPSTIAEEVIIIANDLTPSMTAQLNREFVKGFVTNIGGRTSHSAILARTLEIPAVVGTKIATTQIQDGMMLVLDGTEGVIMIEPTSDQIANYEAKRVVQEQQNKALSRYLEVPTVSKDGHRVELAANIGTPEDVDGALSNGCEGIGLFRTEFLYMGRDELPSEEEQFGAYKTVLEKMQQKPTVVRTLDIGGDKELPYLKLPQEMNPFLGYRAIRLCLDQQEVFRTQLRALLRASVYGQLKIMFPMISTVEEFRQAKAILEEEKVKLLADDIPVSENLEVGMMVETPAAAVIADLFAKEADFLSIGTNDLIQYTLATDRMNEQIAYLYQPYHPAILRLVKQVIDAAHNEGKWVGMCGEMAGDPVAIPLLLGLGLDEFSMSASSILAARALISELSKSRLEQEIQHILSFSTAEEVKSYLEQFI